MNPDMAYKLSDKLSDKTAALIEPVATGRHAVKQGNVKKGDKVLIIGGGIISIATAWWAKKAGAEKIVISEINPARLAHLKKNNIGDEVVNFQEEGVFEAVREKMGYGFDVIFECSHPSSDLFNKTIVPLARKGSVVTQVGVILGPLTIDFYPFIIKELHYQACWSYTEDDFKDAIKAVEENQKELEVHITKVISLEEAQQTFEELISGKSNEIKIMIDPKL
jgi:(R,R)-butanediol dehydrogenase/meso-butanediol dehydrogenase/diacetyl reductase